VYEEVEAERENPDAPRREDLRELVLAQRRVGSRWAATVRWLNAQGYRSRSATRPARTSRRAMRSLAP